MCGLDRKMFNDVITEAMELGHLPLGLLINLCNPIGASTFFSYPFSLAFGHSAIQFFKGR